MSNHPLKFVLPDNSIQTEYMREKERGREGEKERERRRERERERKTERERTNIGCDYFLMVLQINFFQKIFFCIIFSLSL